MCKVLTNYNFVIPRSNQNKTQNIVHSKLFTASQGFRNASPFTQTSCAHPFGKLITKPGSAASLRPAWSGSEHAHTWRRSSWYRASGDCRGHTAPAAWCSAASAPSRPSEPAHAAWPSSAPSTANKNRFKLSSPRANPNQSHCVFFSLKCCSYILSESMKSFMQLFGKLQVVNHFFIPPYCIL